MNSDRADQIIDGTMLSDGAFRKPRRVTHNSYFYLNQSYGGLHLDWVLSVKEAFETVGLSFSDSTPFIEPRVSQGRKHKFCSLWSRYSIEATRCYNRWYSDGHKVVPGDLILTPVTIANWFMGDGSSSWFNSNLVAVNFATHGLGRQGVLRLVGMLMDCGIKTRCGQNKGYPVIFITTTEDVASLMSMIEPHILPSYHYKVKRPWRK